MPIKEYEKYRQYLRTLSLSPSIGKPCIMDKLTFSFALWPEKSGHFFTYHRVYLNGIWTPMVRASLRFYGQWHI